MIQAALQRFAELGIAFQTVAAPAGEPGADPFDLLCHLALDAPMLTRRQGADQVKRQKAAFFCYYGPEAQQILIDLFEKDASDGELQFTLADMLKLPLTSVHGNVSETTRKFCVANTFRNATRQMQKPMNEA